MKNDGRMAKKGVPWKVPAVLGLIHADFVDCSIVLEDFGCHF